MCVCVAEQIEAIQAIQALERRAAGLRQVKTVPRHTVPPVTAGTHFALVGPIPGVFARRKAERKYAVSVLFWMTLIHSASASRSSAFGGLEIASGAYETCLDPGFRISVHH